ncbi:MAG: amidohydrolase [Acidobacteriia bacterium]|nr:amidohydrolase [Terriglobia bacterium]MYG02907.1 amidohydrolase [Terriglobia bacterium]MYK10948.1 amidohydrolase [Terriglobia bacterium]
MTRRSFLLSAAAAAAAPLPFPVIDTHIHLFDPRRPGGIPWPPADDPIRSKPTYPDRFRSVSSAHAVTGAIVVECSPRIEDNQWVLDIASEDKSVVGLVGFLDAGKPGFGDDLERFAKNPLFRGIRYGNLWGRDLAEQLGNSRFIDDMRLVASAGLSLDTANPNLELLEGMLRLSDRVSDLRMVVDHLPKIQLQDSQRARYERILADFSARPQTYVKISAVLLDRGGRVSYDLEDYRATIDQIADAFGEDRVLFGSDWPNSDPLGSYAQVIGIVQEYFASKSRQQQEKYFRLNSKAAYRWIER